MSTETPAVIREPDMPRRVRFNRLQRFGLPALFLIPILSVLNVFGETRETVEAASGDLEVRVEYPRLTRYQKTGDLAVDVRNRSGRRLDSVRVRLDPAYLKNFSDVSVLPSPEGGWEVELKALEPDSSGQVRVELAGERYGSHEGHILVSADGMRGVDARIRTFVLP